MAYIKTREGANSSTNQKEFFLDAYVDLETIPADSVKIGDYAYILNGDFYIMNGSGRWIKQ